MFVCCFLSKTEYKKGVLGQMVRVGLQPSSKNQCWGCRWRRVGGERGNWKMLRDSQDIADVTLVCGNEDGWWDKRILPQGWKMLRDSQDISDVTLVCGNEDGGWDKRILPRGWKMLRDSQDISDVIWMCGNENGWRDKRILPQGWKMIYGQQKEGSRDKNVVSRKARRYRDLKRKRRMLVWIQWIGLWPVSFKSFRKETYLSCSKGERLDTWERFGRSC